MKKLILTACALTCAASVFAQGTVVFNNRVAGTVISHVYGGGPAGGVAVSGNGAGDLPAGTQDWSAYTALAGTGFSAQLFAAPTTAGVIQPDASLIGALPITTFRTGTGAGFVNGVTATLTGVPADAALATLQLRVWDNSSGAGDWATAVQNDVARGMSPAFNVASIGGTINPAPTLNGLQSFNIVGGGGIIPEPSTFALAGLGAAALLIFRRRK